MTLDRTLARPTADSAVNQPDTTHQSLLQEAIHDVTGIVAGNNNSNLRTEIEGYAADAIKAVPLFMAGSHGSYAAAALLYGLDSAKSGTSLSQQMTDFGLGAAQGALTKGAFQMIGKTDLGIAGKGVLMGASSRALGIGLNSSTYMNNGSLDLGGGLANVAKATFNPTSMVTDAVVFGAAQGLFKGVNAATGGALENSKLLSTMATGGTFGFSSGAVGEIQNEQKTGQSLDFGKILGKGLIEAGVMSIAAAPGGMQADPVSARSSERAPAAGSTADSGISSSLRTRISDITGFGKPANDLSMSLASGDVKGANGDFKRAPITDSRYSTDDTDDQPVRKVSAILRDEGLESYADAIDEDPVLRRLKGTGVIAQPANETVAVIHLPEQPGLSEAGVLKIGHFSHGWASDWGTRPFDAPILKGPRDLTLNGNIDATAYVQKLAETQESYPSDDVNVFRQSLVDNGYEFIDPGSHPAKQIGYVDGQLKLIDYSAVGRPGEGDADAELFGAYAEAQRRDNLTVQEEREEDQREQDAERASAMGGTIDMSMEEKRAAALDDPKLSDGQKFILQQLFYGESVDDVVPVQAAEILREQPKMDVNQAMRQAKKDILAMQQQAIRNGLLEGKPKKQSDQW